LHLKKKKEIQRNRVQTLQPSSPNHAPFHHLTLNLSCHHQHHALTSILYNLIISQSSLSINKTIHILRFDHGTHSQLSFFTIINLQLQPLHSHPNMNLFPNHSHPSTNQKQRRKRIIGGFDHGWSRNGRARCHGSQTWLYAREEE